MSASIDSIIKSAGGPTAVGRMVGRTRQAVLQWDEVPHQHVLVIAKGTGYKWTPHKMRRDLYPHPEDGLPEKLRRLKRKR